jgi:hypothetical protein
MEVRSFQEPKFVNIKNASDRIGKLVYYWCSYKRILEKSGIGNIINTYLELDKLDLIGDSNNLLTHIYVYVIYGSVKDFWNFLDSLLYNNTDVKTFPRNKKLIRLGLLVGVWKNGDFSNTKFIVTQSHNELKLIRALIKEVYSSVNIS